jgi:hypothetical protein
VTRFGMVHIFTENNVSYFLGYCSRHVVLIGMVISMFLEVAEFVPEKEMTKLLILNPFCRE